VHGEHTHTASCWLLTRPPPSALCARALTQLVEIKNTIRNLKKDAEMRLTLDVEAQQSFEFLSEQVHGLRKAFSTLSDVLVEEVDLIRSEASERTEEVQQRLDQQAKALKAARTELTLLRSEVQTGRSAAQTKAAAHDERLDAMQDDLTVLAQEVAKGGSAQHLLQLETVQLRSQLEEEARERRSEQEAAAGRLQELRERLEAHDSDARASMQALDADLGTLRAHSERQLGSHAASIEANKSKLLQCAQAIEKQWSTTKVHQQRLESIHSSSALHNQQLQERLETINKQHTRWRASIEDAVKAVAADVQLVQAHGRAMETAIGTSKSESRRLISDHEGETQRQCDTLGRAIHSLADTLNLTSPLIAVSGSPQR
jgi:chromosome segregation ATPase